MPQAAASQDLRQNGGALEVSMQAADIMPRIEGDKLRTGPTSLLKC